jgi:flagellar biosynthesis protein FlhG
MGDMASSIVVASGKGGVGKTSLAVNLGLTLARQGRRTVLFDADFGMANAHILLGANPGRYVMDAIQGNSSMADVLCEAHFGMKFISGGSGLLEMLNLDQTTRYQTIRMVDELRDQTEVLIADVPTSFLDAYSLIKAANLEAGVSNFSIVVNMARSAKEAAQHFEKFQATATRFLDVNLTYAGHLLLSERMRRSVVARRPISMDQPELPENQCLMQISKSVLASAMNDHGGIRFFTSSEVATTGT